MEWEVLGGFCALLFASVACGFSILWALLGGYLLFFAYGLFRGHRPAALARMSFRGIRTVGHILFLFLLIGMITPCWPFFCALPCPFSPEPPSAPPPLWGPSA